MLSFQMDVFFSFQGSRCCIQFGAGETLTGHQSDFSVH